MPEPTPPSLNETTKDSEVALFVKDLAYAGRDCRAQLAEIGHMLDLQPEIELADVVVTETRTNGPPDKWWNPLD